MNYYGYFAVDEKTQKNRFFTAYYQKEKRTDENSSYGSYG